MCGGHTSLTLQIQCLGSVIPFSPVYTADPYFFESKPKQSPPLSGSLWHTLKLLLYFMDIFHPFWKIAHCVMFVYFCVCLPWYTLWDWTTSIFLLCPAISTCLATSTLWDAREQGGKRGDQGPLGSWELTRGCKKPMTTKFSLSSLCLFFNGQRWGHSGGSNGTCDWMSFETFSVGIKAPSPSIWKLNTLNWPTQETPQEIMLQFSLCSFSTAVSKQYRFRSRVRKQNFVHPAVNTPLAQLLPEYDISYLSGEFLKDRAVAKTNMKYAHATLPPPLLHWYFSKYSVEMPNP